MNPVVESIPIPLERNVVELQEMRIDPELGPIPSRAAEWIDFVSSYSRSVDCFDYVPSCPELLYAYLKVVPGRRFCEWGSGLGIGVGLASMLGFRSTGIEIDPGLAELSSRLLAEKALNAKVKNASYHETVEAADVVFVYCWPGQAVQVRERFAATMPHATWLLMGDGAEQFSMYFLDRAEG